MRPGAASTALCRTHASSSVRSGMRSTPSQWAGLSNPSLCKVRGGRRIVMNVWIEAPHPRGGGGRQTPPGRCTTTPGPRRRRRCRPRRPHSCLPPIQKPRHRPCRRRWRRPCRRRRPPPAFRSTATTPPRCPLCRCCRRPRRLLQTLSPGGARQPAWRLPRARLSWRSPARRQRRSEAPSRQPCCPVGSSGSRGSGRTDQPLTLHRQPKINRGRFRHGDGVEAQHPTDGRAAVSATRVGVGKCCQHERWMRVLWGWLGVGCLPGQRWTRESRGCAAGLGPACPCCSAGGGGAPWRRAGGRREGDRAREETWEGGAASAQ